MESCTNIVYKLTYKNWLENSTHTSSYGEITFRIPILSSDSLVLGRMWSQNDVITSWLRMTATSKCFLRIQVRHTQNVWAHSYAVHGRKITAIHSYTHTTLLIFWGSGSLVESKWCHYVMFEADSHLNLIPTSILELYKVFENIDMLSMCIRQ